MALKIEQINQFLGFGNGEKRGEYYFSEGMTFERDGMEPGWIILKDYTESTAITNWFTEVYHSADPHDPYIYAVKSDGRIFERNIVNDWSLQHTPVSTTSHGNGLIVDQKNRLFYAQDRYLGEYTQGSAYQDDWKDFGDNLSPTDSPCPSDLYEDWVVFGHNNNIALLNITDDSWNATAFELPDDFKIRALKSGKSGVLIGANINNRGVLILWDCVTDGSIVPWLWLDDKIESIEKYKGIWIVSTGREYLITNGYNIIASYKSPDFHLSDYNFGPDYPSGMAIDGDKLFVCGDTNRFTRIRKGMYILDLITGLWEFCPISTGNSKSVDLQALFKTSNVNLYISYTDQNSAIQEYYISKIDDHALKTSYISPKVGIGNKKKKAEGIILDLSHSRNYWLSYKNPAWTVKVKLYDFSRQLWGQAQARANATSANEIPIDGSIVYISAEVGDEVTVLEGAYAGEVRHIKSIASTGTASEVWTLDSALAGNIQAYDYLVYMPFKKVGEKTITTRDIKDSRLFIPIKTSMVGRKFLIKLIFEITQQFPHVSNIGFLYEELGY